MWAHGRRRKAVKEQALGTIWEVPDAQWARITPVLAELDPPRRGGKPRIDQRAALNANIYRLRTGCQWNRLPASFPSDSSVHRTLQRWVRRGVLDRVWADLAQAAGIAWDRQALDTSMGKARLGGMPSGPTRLTGPNPG
jgi:transposase